MIKAILIEDEVHVRQALKKMLKLLFPSIEIIGETGFVKDAVNMIDSYKPKLVFMDIELEDGTGFDVLKQLKNSNFKIIFTTAYNQYALQAFKYSTVDYLLKPIDPMELKGAVERAVEKIKDEKEYQKLLEVLKSNLESKEQKIVLKTTEQRYILKLQEIIRLEADGAYTLFVTDSQKIIVSKNIKYYQEILGDDFIRCHQSHLVNLKHIISLNKSGKLQLSNKDEVPVATRKKTEIMQRISSL